MDELLIVYGGEWEWEWVWYVDEFLFGSRKVKCRLVVWVCGSDEEYLEICRCGGYKECGVCCDCKGVNGWIDVKDV